MKLLALLIPIWLIIPISPINAPQGIVEPLGAIIEPTVASIETVEEKIIKMSEEYGVDTETALRIAECESQFGKYNHNWEGSSATGVYQFISKTWENYCEGDVLNEDDNIKCFMELYNKYPHWWACN